MVAEAGLSGDQNYSTVLLPAVVGLLAGQGLRAAELEGYAVVTGPGSFTGLRIGISTVQGLALAARRPCVGMTALDVHVSRILGAAAWLVVLLEAYRDEVYTGIYDAEGRPRAEAAVEPLATLLGRVPAGAAFVGDAVARYRPSIEERCAGALFPERPPRLAATLAQLAARRFAAGEAPPAADIRPFYLREAAIRSSGR